MQIRFDKQAGLLIHFLQSELKFGLAVLKGMNQVVKATFIQEAINDMEDHLQPKKLPMINYFHICALCKCEIDERINGHGFINNQNGKHQWQHYTCPALKPNRSR